MSDHKETPSPLPPPTRWSILQKCPTEDKRVARFSFVCSFRRRGLLRREKRNSWSGFRSPLRPPSSPKTTLSFCGLKCSFQTAAGASATPRVARPSLDLVYLVFHQSLQTRRRNKEKGEKKRRRGSGRRGWLHLTPPQPLHCALRYSKELPPFGNFSKTPVMAFEAAIKNKCFYPLLSLSLFYFFVGLNALPGRTTFHL